MGGKRSGAAVNKSNKTRSAKVVLCISYPGQVWLLSVKPCNRFQSFCCPTLRSQATDDVMQCT